jgi:hypothetical protein
MEGGYLREDVHDDEVDSLFGGSLESDDSAWWVSSDSPSGSTSTESSSPSTMLPSHSSSLLSSPTPPSTDDYGGSSDQELSWASYDGMPANLLGLDDSWGGGNHRGQSWEQDHGPAAADADPPSAPSPRLSTPPSPHHGAESAGMYPAVGAPDGWSSATSSPSEEDWVAPEFNVAHHSEHHTAPHGVPFGGGAAPGRVRSGYAAGYSAPDWWASGGQQERLPHPQHVQHHNVSVPVLRTDVGSGIGHSAATTGDAWQGSMQQLHSTPMLPNQLSLAAAQPPPPGIPLAQVKRPQCPPSGACWHASAEIIQQCSVAGRTPSWEEVESLMLDPAFGLTARPDHVHSRDPCFFIEAPKKRRLTKGADVWKNSGGKSGSTTWPSARPVLRCCYGTVVATNSRTVRRYMEYTFIDQNNPHLTKELLSRHLFHTRVYRSKRERRPKSKKSDMGQLSPVLPVPPALPAPAVPIMPAGISMPPVLPQRAPIVRQETPTEPLLPDQPERDPMNTVPDMHHQPFVDHAGAGLFPIVRACEVELNEAATPQGAPTETVLKVMNAAAQAAVRGNQEWQELQRPRTMGHTDPRVFKEQIYVEVGQHVRRRMGSGDKWINAGGKRSIVRTPLPDGDTLERRAGKIVMRSDSGTAATSSTTTTNYSDLGTGPEGLRYHRYVRSSALGSQDIVTVYHVFQRVKRQSKPKKRGPTDTLPPPGQGEAARLKRSRARVPAQVGTALLAGIALVAAIVAMSYLRSNVSTEKAASSNHQQCTAGYFYTSTVASEDSADSCQACRDCSKLPRSYHARSCTTTADTACLQWAPAPPWSMVSNSLSIAPRSASWQQLGSWLPPPGCECVDMDVAGAFCADWGGGGSTHWCYVNGSDPGNKCRGRQRATNPAMARHKNRHLWYVECAPPAYDDASIFFFGGMDLTVDDSVLADAEPPASMATPSPHEVTRLQPCALPDDESWDSLWILDRADGRIRAHHESQFCLVHTQSGTSTGLEGPVDAVSFSMQSCNSAKNEWYWDVVSLVDGHPHTLISEVAGRPSVLTARPVEEVVQLQWSGTPDHCLAYYDAQALQRLSLQQCSKVLNSRGGPYSSLWVVDTRLQASDTKSATVNFRLLKRREDDPDLCLTAVKGSVDLLAWFSRDYNNMVSLAPCNLDLPAQRWYWQQAVATKGAKIETAMTQNERRAAGWSQCAARPPPGTHCAQKYTGNQSYIPLLGHCAPNNQSGDIWQCLDRNASTDCVGCASRTVDCVEEAGSSCCVHVYGAPRHNNGDLLINATELPAASGATAQATDCSTASSWIGRAVSAPLPAWSLAQQSSGGNTSTPVKLMLAKDNCIAYRRHSKQSRPPPGCQCVGFDGVMNNLYYISVEAHCADWQHQYGAHDLGWCITNSSIADCPQQSRGGQENNGWQSIPGIVDCISGPQTTAVSPEFLYQRFAKALPQHKPAPAISSCRAGHLSDELWRLDLRHNANATMTRIGSGFHKHNKWWPRRSSAVSAQATQCIQVGALGNYRCTAGIMFGGDFDFCPDVDLWRNISADVHSAWAGLGSEQLMPVEEAATSTEVSSDDVWIPPDVLQQHNASGWFVLGGVSHWIRMTKLNGDQVFDTGYVNYFVPEFSRYMAWPFGRDRAQSWRLNLRQRPDVVLLFSGRLRVAIRDSRAMNPAAAGITEDRKAEFLLNDMWMFDPHAPLTGTRELVALRIAGSAHQVDRIMDLPLTRVNGKFYYPGPRMDGATWSSSLDLSGSHHYHYPWQWLFGGIGKRTSNPSDTVGASRTLERYGDDWVTNLCDLWSYEQRVGWKLISVCSRDLPFLRGMTPSAHGYHFTTSGPAASILSSTWVDDAQNLWLFGGVTDCEQASGGMHGRTVCDVQTPAVTETTKRLVDQVENITRCSTALWRFDTGGWSRIETGSSTFPWAGQGRCAATALKWDSGSLRATDGVSLVGGWSDVSDRDCAAAHHPGCSTGIWVASDAAA